ncbi:tolloid-like protein 1 [Diadema antillarum]|uniref:tolloid-like protein 1 n=1 Tax=Diadema antillarum TaxID=105358 RepID=UPI003A8C7DF3
MDPRKLTLPVTIASLLICLRCGCVTSCSETEVSLSSDGQLYVISSPFFPDDYPSDLDCNYHMVAPEGRRVRLYFTFFHLENANDLELCIFDYLAVYDGGSDGDASFGKFCGRDDPPTLVSTGREMYIVFHTDSSIEQGGFRAEITDVDQNYVEPVPTPALGSCYHTYTEEYGVFYSPGFPDYYGNGEECLYVISSSKVDNTILLRFPSFDLEPSYNCVYDYVEVRDGATEASALIDRYCGSSSTLSENAIESTGQSLFVRFRSDSSSVFKGFYAEYADSDTGLPDQSTDEEGANQFSVCDLSHAVLTERGGTIVSHPSYPDGNYENSQYCTVTIIASRAHEKIYFDLIETDMPPAADCGASGDYVQLLDGDNGVQSSQTLGYFCGDAVGRYSTQNSFGVVRFISDSVPNSALSGFKLVYAIYYVDQYGCDEGDWHCDNDRCVDEGLVCDGYDHCGDNSDEELGCRRSSGKTWKIAVGVSAAIIAVGIAAFCILYKMSNRKPIPQGFGESSSSLSMSRNNRVSDSPRERGLVNYTVSGRIGGELDSPPQYASVYDHRSPESTPSAPPWGTSSSSPPSYLELGSGGQFHGITGLSAPKEQRLEPISRGTSSPRTSTSTTTSAAGAGIDMNALPKGRANALPPIKRGGNADT